MTPALVGGQRVTEVEVLLLLLCCCQCCNIVRGHTSPRPISDDTGNNNPRVASCYRLWNTVMGEEDDPKVEFIL